VEMQVVPCKMQGPRRLIEILSVLFVYFTFIIIIIISSLLYVFVVF
jgi:hypothetical protein